ncbi:MAG: diaminopimelate dehydrogenase [Firmicutes bacterium]|nr:diaminopimelate dehydrogenase [Bacillota bacterium]
MSDEIRIGIVGYGNLGRGVEKAISQTSDMELVAIFTRRPPDQIQTTGNLVSAANIDHYQSDIDVMILCGGSSTDLPEQGPLYATQFNTVDSFDFHARIPAYFAKIDQAAKGGGNLSLISTGWDPGLFSLARLLFASVLPAGKTYTFWGKGVSQGHSVAIRRIPGVRHAVQYTVPVPDTIDKIRQGMTPALTPREEHLRICYVVAEPQADLAQIESTIKTMPGYFADFDTTVHFITEEEFANNHTGMPHGGFVIRTGTTGDGHQQQTEFRLTLESNPEFTGSVLTAYARAVYRMRQAGETGARTVFDIPLGYLSHEPPAELRKHLL